MDSLVQDVRYAVRLLVRQPGFTAVAVLTLALGIGANTAIFSVVYSVLLKPLPYIDADRVVVANISVPDYRDLKETNQAFDVTAIWASNQYSLKAGDETETLLGATVSPNFFAMLGQPMLGRAFSESEDHEALVVLSYDLWRRRFGAAPEVLGRAIELGGLSYTIVGVMPREFEFPDSEFKLWVTFGSAMAVTPQQAENRQLRIFRLLAHLRPSVSFEQAQAEMDAFARRQADQYPKTNEGVGLRLTPLYERIVGDVRTPLFVLLATVGLVLLIACANVANLMLARTTAREREMAIRAAIGAGRWRVARQLLTESVLLAILGAALGVLLAVWGIGALRSLQPGNVPRLSSISLSMPVLLFTLSLSVVTGMLFGLAPALHASRINLVDMLKEGGRGLSARRWGRRMRAGLVVGEIALSLVVLVAAGLLVKSFSQMLRSDAGFVADNVLTLNLELFRFDDPQRRAQVAREVIARLEQLPGVEAVGAATGLPPVTPQRGTRFAVSGVEITEPGADGAYFIAATPNYFRALGTPLIAGREFDERDADGTPLVAIINQRMARQLFAGESPIGRQLKLINPEQSADWRTIVGVVGDIKYQGLDSEVQQTIYTPFPQTPFPWAYTMVRATGEPAALIASIRGAVGSVDPKISAVSLRPMRQLVSQSVAQPRFNMSLLAAFALLALVLAAVGLYGVMSYLVTQRTREVGIRMALGAARADVLRLVVGQGLKLALGGIALGLAGALAATRVIASLLYGVSATDPMTFFVISLLLAAVAVVACLIPALRATRVDPMIALRYE